MAFERAEVFEVSSLGVESVLGTPVAVTKRLLGTSIVNKIMPQVKTARPRGGRVGTIGIEDKEWTEQTWTGDIATYTDPLYAFAAMFGAPNITTPGGGTNTRNQQFIPPMWAAINGKSLTIESGNFVRAGKSAACLVKTIGFDFTRDGVSWNAAGFGQKFTDGITLNQGTNEVQTLTITGTPTGGTVTLSFYGESTGTIAYNASAGTVQTAFEALPNIGTGNVTAGGGPWPGSAITLTFKGPWAGVNVPLVVLVTNGLTGGSSPTLTPTETTPGAALSALEQQPVAGDDWDFFLDTTAAGLGGTQLTRVLKASWSISDIVDMLWVANTSNTSWVNSVPLAPTTEFRFTVEADATGMSYLSNLQAGTMVFPRIKALGATIEGALKYQHQHDFAVKLTNIDNQGTDQGVTTVEYTGEIQYDATWAQWCEFNLRNTITAL